MLGLEKAHREQNKICFPGSLASWYFFKFVIDVNGDDAGERSLVIPNKMLTHNRIFSRVVAEPIGSLRVSVIHSVNAGPQGPRVVSSSFSRRLGQQLKIHQTFTAMSERRADTICSRITAADDDDLFTLGRNILAIFKI